MQAADIRVMLDYNWWARDRLLEAVAPLTAEQYTRDMGNSFTSVRDTMNHLYGAEWIWTERLAGRSPAGFPPEDSLPDLPALRAAWHELDATLRRFAASLDDQGVARAFEFKTFSAGQMTASVSQVIHHVTNHATYHRGQVTTMLRQLGATPPKSMDLILYYRERAATS